MSLTDRVFFRALLPVGILVGAMVAFGALYATRPRSEPVSVEEKAWPVAARRVHLQDLRPHLSLYGRVESPRAARLTAAVSGEVNELHVLEGATVSAGQPLITIDHSDYALLLTQRESELNEIEAQIASEKQQHRTNQASLEHEQQLLELSRRGVRRAEDLARTNVGSQAGLDEARREEQRQSLAVVQRQLAIREHSSRVAELRARQAKSEALRDRVLLDIERTRIAAPFNGRITATLVAPGDRVRAGDRLLEMYDTEVVEIRAQIPTRYLDTVTQAVQSGARLPASATVGGHPVSAELDRLAGQVRRGSGGLDGLFRITRGADLLPVGRTLELVVSLPVQRDVIALPFEAIYGTNRVYRLTDGRMQGVTVERIGETRFAQGNREVLLRSLALTEGDGVVVTQLPHALEGLKVRVVGGIGAAQQEQQVAQESIP